MKKCCPTSICGLKTKSQEFTKKIKPGRIWPQSEAHLCSINPWWARDREVNYGQIRPARIIEFGRWEGPELKFKTHWRSRLTCSLNVNFQNWPPNIWFKNKNMRSTWESMTLGFIIMSSFCWHDHHVRKFNGILLSEAGKYNQSSKNCLMTKGKEKCLLDWSLIVSKGGLDV